MIQLVKMAFRNLGRNRRRTFFSMLALGMGLSLLLLIAGVLKGEVRDSMQLSIDLVSGHLQVRAASYEEDRTSLKWEDLLQSPAAAADQIAALPQVKAATPRLFASGILTSGDDSAGVRIIGVDPASAANAPYLNGMMEGAFVTADDREGVVIGLPLAQKLTLSPGDQILLLVNTSDGEADQQPFTIRGIYSTRTPTFDEGIIFLPLAKAQTITRAGDRASTLFVLLHDIDQTDAVAAALSGENLKVITYKEANAMIVMMEEFAGAYMMVIYLIVLAVTGTVIANTLVMSVYERTREIGILSAIGMSDARIMGMFIAESGLLAVGGIAVGLILGGVVVYYASTAGFHIGDIGTTGLVFRDTIYAHLTLEDTVTLSITAFVVTLVAGLIPAVVAARMEPVQALHSGK